VTSEEIHDYLGRNHVLAARLVGSRLTAVTRWLDAPAEVEARVEYGPAELVAADGRHWLVDVEESKANIIIFDLANGISGPWYSGFHLREPVVRTRSGNDPLSFLLDESIAQVEIISREPEPGVPDSFAMCGLRLTTGDGHQVCIGTCLTHLLIQEVVFLLPTEVDPNLRYHVLPNVES
jgi:hypothetical protein